MNIIGYIKRNGNFSSLIMGIGTVIAGTAAAVVRGNMEVLPATVCLLFAIFLQLGANYFHSYCELGRYYDTLEGNAALLPTDGMHSDKQLSKRLLQEAATACLLVSLMLGMTIMAMAEDSWWTIIAGIIIFGMCATLSVGPKPLTRTPWALVCTFVLFGPIGVWGTSIVQCQHDANDTVWSLYDMLPMIYVGIAMGFLSCNTYLLYSYRNYKYQKETNYRGITAKFGPKTVEWLVFANGLLMLISMTMIVTILNFSNPLVALLPAVVSFALTTYIALRMRHGALSELSHLTVLSKVNYLLTAVLLFIIWWALGVPDDSMRVFF